jgi:hypothetical protein
MNSMKKLNLIFLLILLTFNVSVSAQSETFKILLGEDDVEIVKYYNSLKKLFPDNPYIEIENKTTIDGNKVFEFALPSKRDGKVDFYGTWSVFERFDDGKEVCFKQLFLFDISEVYESLAYIKDNYTSISPNQWEKKLTDKISYVATFNIKDKSATIEVKLKIVN